MDIANKFYDRRAAEAADSIMGTDEWGERSEEAVRRINEFESALDGRQKEMYFEVWAAQCDRDLLAYRAVYKAGFLDGVAVGMTAEGHEKEADRMMQEYCRDCISESRAKGAQRCENS